MVTHSHTNFYKMAADQSLPGVCHAERELLILLPQFSSPSAMVTGAHDHAWPDPFIFETSLFSISTPRFYLGSLRLCSSFLVTVTKHLSRKNKNLKEPPGWLSGSAPITKPEELSSVPWIHIVEGENELLKIVLRKCTRLHTCTHTHLNLKQTQGRRISLVS